MAPYRLQPSAERNPKVSFGSERYRILFGVGGLLLISATIATIVAWYAVGGGIRGSILLPAILGVFLLASSRSGSIELRENRELSVNRRSFLWRRRIRVPADELTGVTVAPSDWKYKGEFDLCLVLTRGRTVPLLHASRSASLEPSRGIVAAFLLEHGLLGGGLGQKASLVRIQASQTSPDEVDDDSEAGDQRRGEH